MSLIWDHRCRFRALRGESFGIHGVLLALFRENYSSWDALNSILAEIDCLCSLSAISFLSNGIMCRPELSPMDPDVEPFVYMEDARHPCVCMTGINFIPNDIKIGKDLKF